MSTECQPGTIRTIPLPVGTPHLGPGGYLRSPASNVRVLAHGDHLDVFEPASDDVTEVARVLADHTDGAIRMDAWVCAECGAPLAMPGWEATVEGTTGGLLRDAMAKHQTELLAEAGLLRQEVPPSACADDGISMCPKMAYSNKQIGRERDEARAQVERVRALAKEWARRHGLQNRSPGYGSFAAALHEAIDGPGA